MALITCGSIVTKVMNGLVITLEEDKRLFYYVSNFAYS